jgi:3-phosphoshikimate 1-carboxyvinyltransferase
MTDIQSATVFPCSRLAGAVRLQGDKSISHRLAMLAALAEPSAPCRLRGFLMSEDCRNTLAAVQTLGAQVVVEGADVLLTGAGTRWRAPDKPLDMGNSGTGLRLLAGLLAGQPFVSELTGDRSLCSRPMGRIREPLERMGARVELLGPDGRPPVRITGGSLAGMDYTARVASAQVKSCVLLAGLFARGVTRYMEPMPSRDHTERLLRAWGVPLAVEGNTMTLEGYGPEGPRLAPRDWTVPGDFSSAAFWLVAGAAGPGSTVAVRNVGVNPRRTALLAALSRMGGRVQTVLDPTVAESWEPAGEVSVAGAGLVGTDIGGAEIPNLIDELPILAVAAALAEGQTVIRNAEELRVKESDRITKMALCLKNAGVQVEERPDGMVVRGPTRVRGGIVQKSFGDHRIAMSMAVLGLFADAPTRLLDVGCVATSYPDFWRDLRSLGGHVELDHSH